ncbi:hypothetical protein PB2503_00792 [Parvularcula bermudensis HTCC2503]|uniref:Uncharacterized protein n=1 Tax=Parvularcula bermudensis (strain ATCC BAA-594 / HTCC2503 / KCTC 12087) TaxID=314260 RepID=E0TB30_PARBH|nr:hypothetical protein [Parvularcula bermudensis]ADM08239.1 hypothetical protein PB2503_00792 [Parvularcula bermudensis HTCC2503]
MGHQEYLRRTAFVRCLFIEPPKDVVRAAADHPIEFVGSERQPDIVLADLREIPDEQLAGRIATAQQAATGTPLLFLIGGDQRRAAPILSAVSIDTVVMSAPGEAFLMTAIKRRVLQADRAEEVALRLEAMAALGRGALPVPCLRPQPRALFVGLPGALSLKTLTGLTRLTPTGAALSRHQALTLLEMKAADRVFIQPHKQRRQMTGLVRLIRRHSELSSLPVIVLEKHAKGRHRAFWATAGANAVVEIDDLPLAVGMAEQLSRESQLAKSVEDNLADLSFTDDGTQSRLCGGRFFEAVLAQRCRSAHAPFSLGAVRLIPQSLGTPHPAIFSEPAVYAAMGATNTDLIMRAAPDLLLISLPGSDRIAARRTLRLLATLISDLKFGATEEARTFATRTAVVSARQGADPKTLIRQLVAAVGEERAETRELA